MNLFQNPCPNAEIGCGNEAQTRKYNQAPYIRNHTKAAF
jgi:hypothetical protein